MRLRFGDTFLEAAAVALLVMFLVLGCWAVCARADFTALGPGAVIAVSTNANVVYLPAQKGGSLLNNAGVSVYIGWNANTVSADKTAGDGKSFLNAGDAISIPRRVSHFAIRTAGDGVGVVQYLEP